MDLSRDDIQSHRVVMLGEQFDVGIMFELTDQSSLLGYSYTVRFNADVLELVDRQETYPPGFGKLVSGDRPDVVFGADDPVLGGGNFGEMRTFEAGTLGDAVLAPWSFQVATLTFRAKSLTSNEPMHVLPRISDASGDGFFGNEFEVMPFLSEGGGVTVVPEPSSMVLLGLGMFGMLAVTVYRRRILR